MFFFKICFFKKKVRNWYKSQKKHKKKLKQKKVIKKKDLRNFFFRIDNS